MDHSTSSGDEDIVRGRSHNREGNNDTRQNSRHHTYYNHAQHYNLRDFDTRSQSSQKSDPNSETSGRGEPLHYNLSAESVGSYGSGGGDSRGFPLHGHVHFRHSTMSATHLLNGDPAHQFPPSLYQSSADAPKSDTATVCSSSMLEDIEDVDSHYDGDCTQTSNSKQNHHHYPPPGHRRSNSKEGNRLVDFAERSQAVFPKQNSKSAGLAGSSSQEASLLTNDEDTPAGTNTQYRKGMGPPLSRHLLLQHYGISPFRTGSVKSGGSNAGSDVIVNVGSDCGGSLTDVQSLLSQEDAALLTIANSESTGEPLPLTASVASVVKTETLDMSVNANSTTAAVKAEDENKPHPLLCDQSDSNTNGRISPGGTIYRGRGVRRYKGRFYALPLKRFHQDGVHLHSDNELEGSQYREQQHLERRSHECGNRYRSEDSCVGNFRGDYQHGGDNHSYYDDSSSQRQRGYNHCRAYSRRRSRSRSRSPPSEMLRREGRARNLDHTRGYKIEKNDRSRQNSPKRSR